MALRQVIESGDALHVGAVAARHDLGFEFKRGERFGERAGVRDVDQARRQQGRDMLELGVVLALERIGDRNRRHGNAGGVAGEREQRVIDAVGGQNHHRPFGREPALDQTLRQRVHERSRRRIGQLAPAAAVALGQEQACGIALDRRTEKARQARIVGRQGLARAAVQSAVAGRFAHDAWARVGDRA